MTRDGSDLPRFGLGDGRVRNPRIPSTTVGQVSFGRPVDMARRREDNPARLVHLLLLVETDLPGSHVHQKEKTADDGEDLEEVVLDKIFVGMAVVELSER